MQLVACDPRHLDSRDLVVRERCAGSLVMAAVMLPIALGWTAGPWMVDGLPGWMRALASLLFGLPLCWIAAVLARGAARGLRRGRWTLRVGPEGLWLNPRSYLNEASGRTPAPWLRLSWSDLTAASAGEQRAHVPDEDGGRTQIVDRWIDLELSQPLAAEALRALERERGERVGTRFLAFPIEPRGERALRVHWHTRGLALAPTRERVLEVLGQRVSVRAPEDAATLQASELATEEVEALARDLHARGRVMEALRLLRARNGWSLGRARAWLRAGKSRAAS